MADLDEEQVLSTRQWRRPSADSAWVLLFADGLLLGGTSMFWIMWGHFFDPQFYSAISHGTWDSVGVLAPNVSNVSAAGVRLAGFLGAILSVFVIVVATTSFRRGERWAWYVMWTLPFLATLDFALVSGYGAVTIVSVLWDTALFVLALGALVIPYRYFFPNNVRAVRAAATTPPQVHRVSQEPTRP